MKEEQYDWWESLVTQEPTVEQLLAEHHTEFSELVINEIWLEQYRKAPRKPIPMKVALELARVIWISRSWTTIQIDQNTLF